MSQGKRVGSGRLRVDAARAVGKLRDYQLPDPTAWVLEVVRAAVAFGASAVRVTGDADDVRVAWDGPGPDDDSLPRLFDELVDPAPRRERRPIRLLATGVNTALGLEPRWVDVIVTDGEGGATAVRYSPRLLEAKDGTASALRELRTESRRPPREAPARGGLVHLRRLPLLDAVPILVGYGEPRELSIARASCDDSRVPIHVGRSELGQPRSHGDLLRLGLGDGLDGFLALLDPSFAVEAARLEVAELGVVLARYQLPLDAFGVARAAVPLRLFIDAPRMPTNASRSAVRLDEEPLQSALTQAAARLPAMIERLATELGDAPEHPWSPVQRERLRAAAIQLLAVHAAGGDWRIRLVGRPLAVLEPLLDLPLLRDALGRPRTPRSFRITPRGVERVHLGRDALPAELEPWLGDSLWAPPGDPASALLGAWVPEAASELAKLAVRHRTKRERFTSRKPVKPDLAGDPANLLVVPLREPGRSLKSCVDGAPFAVEGLAGELAIRDARGAGSVTILVDGRPIARWSPVVPRGVEGVATCDGLTPTVDYEGVLDDETFARLRRAVCAAAVVGYEALALRWQGRASRGDRARDVAPWIEGARDADGERIRATLIGGVACALEVLATSSADVDPQSRRDAAVRAFLASKSPLADAAIWAVVGGGRASTRQLFSQGSTAPFLIGYHHGSGPDGAREGRSVYALSSEDVRLLRDHLPSAQLVDYGRALQRAVPPPRPGELAAQVLPALGVAIEIGEPGVRAAIAWGGFEPSTRTVRHWGVRFAHDPIELTPPTLIVIEDATLTPDASFQHARAIPDYPIDAWIAALARDFAATLTGADAPRLLLGAPAAVDATAGLGAFFSWLGAAPAPETVLGARAFAALRHVPFVTRLGRAERSTLAEVELDFGAESIDWVPTNAAAAFELGDWHPVSSTPAERTAFGRILGRELADGSLRLEALRRAAARTQALERHRSRAAMNPAASWTGPRVEVTGQGILRAGVSIASRATARVQVLIESRPFLDLEREETLPLDAFLDLPPSAADEDFVALSDEGEQRIKYVLGAGTRELLVHVATASPGSLIAAHDVRALLAAWCERLRDQPLSKTDRRAVTVLRAARAYETIQGALAALDDAVTDGGTVRVAVWDEPWIGPAEGEKPDAMDRPVLRLPAEDSGAFRAMLRVLVENGTTRDLTSKIGRLQSARRVAHGMMSAPRLEGVYEPRFRFPLSELLDETTHASALEALGIGEAALAAAPRSRVVFSRGEQRRVVESGLIPAVHVAAHRPDLSAKAFASDELRKSAEAALEVLIGLVVRRVVDRTPADQLPEWARRSLLGASLRGGALHLDRLADTPMFPTSVGTWVTPREVLMQAQRFGTVWTTSRLTELVPLDPARIALRLDREQTEQLTAYAAAERADEELDLDQRARANLQQPPVTSLDPTPEERDGALMVVPLIASDGSSAHGTLTLLMPAKASLRGFYPSRSFHPLGRHPDPARWPCVVRIDDPAFTPDRTWSRPLEDDVAQAVRQRVRSAIDARVVELLPFPQGKLVAARPFPSTAKDIGLGDAALEAVIWLERDGAPGALTVHDPRGKRVIASVAPSGRPLPVHGDLLTTVALDEASLRGLAAKLHEALLKRLCERLGGDGWGDRDVGLACLLAALGEGATVPQASLGRVRVPGVVPETSLWDLQESLLRGAFVAACTPPELEMAKAAREGLLVVDDGSAPVRAVLGYLGARALAWRQLQRAAVLGGVEAAALDVLAQDGPRAPSSAAKPARGLLERAMLERWSRLPLGALLDVRIDGRRRRPAVSFIDESLVLAGRHPAVRRAVEACELGSARADAMIALLLASGAGAKRRTGGHVGAAGEHAFLTELMRDATARGTVQGPT